MLSRDVLDTEQTEIPSKDFLPLEPLYGVIGKHLERKPLLQPAALANPQRPAPEDLLERDFSPGRRITETFSTRPNNSAAVIKRAAIFGIIRHSLPESVVQNPFFTLYETRWQT